MPDATCRTARSASSRCGAARPAGCDACGRISTGPEETAAAIRDGWFHTGDLARRDADGYLYIVDRKKDMVLSGGFNIYSKEVEAVLGTHPAWRRRR